MDLSANLRSIVSLRLIRTEDGKGRKAAIEILLNPSTIAENIFKRAFGKIKDIMEKSRELGMRTFEWALFELCVAGHIGFEEAIRNADCSNELRLAIKLKSRRGEPTAASGPSLSFEKELSAQERADEREAETERQQKRRRKLEDQELGRTMKEKGLDSRFNG